MGEIKGTVRNQYRMFCLAEAIEEDSEVRFYDAFVDSMDLEDLGFTIRESKSMGRNSYSTSSLVKLYLYGYYNNIRSSRRLAKACKVNLEIKWLINELSPSHKTISEFRRLNTGGFKKIFDYLMLFLRKKGVFTHEETIGVDGTRLHGQNSKLQNFNKRKLDQLIARAEKQIGEYLGELDQADSFDNEDGDKQADDKGIKKEQFTNSDEIERVEKLKKLKGNLAKNKDILKRLEASDDEQISLSDPDSRRIARIREGSIVGYNGQIATTGQSKLIVASEVTNKPDTNTLAGMAKQAQTNLGKKELNVLADCGFSESEQLYECEQEQLTPYVPSKPAPYEKIKGEFAKSKFNYNEEQDNYLCPNNKQLQTNGKWYIRKNKGRKEKRYKEYVMRGNVCTQCPFRTKCQSDSDIKAKKQKHLKRYEYEEYRQASNERAKSSPEFYKQRKAIVEHPFGTLKRSMGFTYFLLQGLEKVNAEFKLICSCYNIKRIIKMYGVKQLIKALKELIYYFLAICRTSRFTVAYN